SWIAIGSSAPLHIAPSGGGGCGRDELGGVTRSGGSLDAAGVTCPHWVAAIPGERPGSILVARCDEASCGPLLEWRTLRSDTSGLPPPPAKGFTWPSWATWTLVGIGAAA